CVPENTCPPESQGCRRGWLRSDNQCERSRDAGAGRVIDGLSTMLGLEITFENGRNQQSNFNQYPIPRMAHAPVVEAHFIEADYPPTDWASRRCRLWRRPCATRSSPRPATASASCR